MVYFTTVSLGVLIQETVLTMYVSSNVFYKKWYYCQYKWLIKSPHFLSFRFFYFVHTLFCIYCIWWLQWSAIKPEQRGTERCPTPHKQHSHKNRYRWGLYFKRFYKLFKILHQCDGICFSSWCVSVIMKQKIYVEQPKTSSTLKAQAAIIGLSKVVLDLRKQTLHHKQHL